MTPAPTSPWYEGNVYRPAVFEKPLGALPYVGAKRAHLLAEGLNLHTVEDLLYFFPYRYVDKTRVVKAVDLKTEGEQVSLVGRLEWVNLTSGGRPRLIAGFSDGSGRTVELTWFQGIQWLHKRLQAAGEVALFGKVSFFNGQLQMVHPEVEPLTDDEDPAQQSSLLAIVPFYYSTDPLRRVGLDTRGLRRVIYRLLDETRPFLYEYLPPGFAQTYGLMPLPEALMQLHRPTDDATLYHARERLKFDELFLFQLAMGTRRHQAQLHRQANVFTTVGHYFNTFYHQHLPFALTNAQKRVVKEIRADTLRPAPMNRLVQGDVGSGKTIVAVLAMLLAKDNGFQAVLMAPTEILAEQHYRSITALVEPLGLRTELLTGSTRTKHRNLLLQALATGHIDFLIGTHALLEDPVQFARLGLTIIDEQHKFGVRQRGRLWNKAPVPPHNLAMSATPIPRTLALTLYGDLDVSVIDELPPGRKPVKTVLRTEAQRLEVFGAVRRQLQNQHQAYFVYPLVEESAKVDLLACEAGFELIQRAFPEYRVGIVHGKMKPDAKEHEMQRFKRNETQILVSTTVIEVGVDVPNATIMVIENAERYGLSQLHQLRGRVGRGGNQSFTILMTPKPVFGDALKRLRALCDTNDGFKIAEIDLTLRGPGDFLGTKQSGLPDFKLANIVHDQPLVEIARAHAQAILAQDPTLSSTAHPSLRGHYLRYVAKNRLEELVA
jgi:ATP-dependent DNA helicase RecG